MAKDTDPIGSWNFGNSSRVDLFFNRSDALRLLEITNGNLNKALELAERVQVGGTVFTGNVSERDKEQMRFEAMGLSIQAAMNLTVQGEKSGKTGNG